MDRHLAPGAVVMPQAASLHMMVVEFRVGYPEVFGQGMGGPCFLVKTLDADGATRVLIVWASVFLCHHTAGLNRRGLPL